MWYKKQSLWDVSEKSVFKSIANFTEKHLFSEGRETVHWEQRGYYKNAKIRLPEDLENLRNRLIHYEIEHIVFMPNLLKN